MSREVTSRAASQVGFQKGVLNRVVAVVADDHEVDQGRTVIGQLAPDRADTEFIQVRIAGPAAPP